MKWYAHLADCKNLVIKDYIDLVRDQLRHDRSQCIKLIAYSSIILIVDSTAEPPSPFSNATNLPGSEPATIDRPSEYLRARCPLCFGGKQYHEPGEMYME
jgi:hypothetical protein